MSDTRARSLWAQGLDRLLSLASNWISLFGLLLMSMALVMLIAFAVLALRQGTGNPYLNVIGYLVVPGVFLSGLLLVPIGSFWQRWRLQRGSARGRIALDLNDRPTLGAVLVFAGVTFFVVLPALVVSNYEAFRYSESTQFCATTCHTVMEPEGTAHARSAHARVTCADCHIGEGAGWFVKSKLSGVRQIFAVWGDSYSRPIPPAITELRPARETCEQCHWPAKFFGSQLKQIVHFTPDQQNTRREVRMLLKVGGADESIGRVEGIHMHMLVKGRVEYVARDSRLQEIPWVRYVRPDGTSTVFRSDGLANSAAPPEGIVRAVDCMDCHNRGAHHFRPPATAVDQRLESRQLDATLPFIKREAVAALTADYPNLDAALAGIAAALKSFYDREYPDVATKNPEGLARAVSQVQEIYRTNFFPAMKVDWKTYPENVGHMFSRGCMRCHDGLHKDEQGRPISSDCNTCHVFLNPTAADPTAFREGNFEHAMDIHLHENLRCDQCHTGGSLLLCRDCHAELKGLSEWHDEPGLRRTGVGDWQPASAPSANRP